MVSRAGLEEDVRAFRWREVGETLAPRPDLLGAVDKKGRNWLHHCCRSPLAGRDPADSIRIADLLIDLGLGLNAPAFREGEWQATPLWFAIAWGKNLPLAAHLLKRGANPNFCLFAAIWNNDRAAIPDYRNEKGVTALHMMLKKGSAPEHFRLFARHGARGDIEDADGRTAAEILRRKRSPEYRAVADALASAPPAG
jgi:hypothetical protein